MINQKLSKQSFELIGLFPEMKPEEIIGLAKLFGVQIGQIDCADQEGNEVPLNEAMNNPKDYKFNPQYRELEDLLTDIVVEFETLKRAERRAILRGLKRRKK